MVRVGYDIVVRGLGVAGSTLAYAASRAGFRVLGFDLASSYRKACGDVVTLRSYTWEVIRATGSLLTFVKRYSIRVGGVEAAYIDFHRPVWAVVDKSKLVNELRAMAKSEGAELRVGKTREVDGAGLVVDARGPYAHSLDRTVLTLRFIARARWEPGLALIDFDPHNVGFYWVFPMDDDGRIINIGSGFERVTNARVLEKLTLKYYKSTWGGPLEVLDVRGAPVAVKAPIDLGETPKPRVGEAAGLVNSTSGEGNRYAIHSALALTLAVSRCGFNEFMGEYGRLVAGIISEISLSRTLLALTESLNPRLRARLLLGAPKTFWAKWLEGRMGWRELLSLTASLHESLGLLRALSPSA